MQLEIVGGMSTKFNIVAYLAVLAIAPPALAYEPEFVQRLESESLLLRCRDDQGSSLALKLPPTELSTSLLSLNVRGQDAGPARSGELCYLSNKFRWIEGGRLRYQDIFCQRGEYRVVGIVRIGNNGTDALDNKIKSGDGRNLFRATILKNAFDRDPIPLGCDVELGQ